MTYTVELTEERIGVLMVGLTERISRANAHISTLEDGYRLDYWKEQRDKASDAFAHLMRVKNGWEPAKG